jgi:hypothetical protein
MRTSLHLSEAPHLRWDNTAPSAPVAGFVEIRPSEFGPTIAISATDFRHLEAIALAFANAASMLKGATWNRAAS